MRSIGPAVTREQSPAFLRNSNGRLDFPGPTQEASWIPRRTRESRCNSRKSTWFPRHRKMKPFPAISLPLHPSELFSGFILQKIIWSSSVDLSPSQGIFWPQASPIPKNLKPVPPLLSFSSSTEHVLAHLIFTTTYEIAAIILTSCHFLNPNIYWVLSCASNIQITWHALPHLSSEIGTVIIPNLQWD